MNFENDFNNMAGDLSNKLKQLQTFANSSFEGLTPEAQNELKGKHHDLNQAITAARTGDISKLTKLANKYADTNRDTGI